MARSMAFKVTFAFLTSALVAATAYAQSSGLYVYPAKGQSAAQQEKDKNECNSWAISQTAGNTQSASAAQQPQGHVVRGAARGAALGAVGGAITGNAGTGAAAGAAMGGVAGGFRRRDAKRQQQANAEAANQDAYKRAMAACLQGRGYTVN